jgi:hypothetical protein
MLLCVLAALTLAGVAHGETYVTADITSSTSWTPAGSPYIIQANVAVTNNSTLSIEAGVTVAFDGFSLRRTRARRRRATGPGYR